jgi:hypothetical protein
MKRMLLWIAVVFFGLGTLSGIVEVIKTWGANDPTSPRGSSEIAAAIAAALIFAALTAICFSKLKQPPTSPPSTET